MTFEDPGRDRFRLEIRQDLAAVVASVQMGVVVAGTAWRSLGHPPPWGLPLVAGVLLAISMATAAILGSWVSEMRRAGQSPFGVRLMFWCPATLGVGGALLLSL